MNKRTIGTTVQVGMSTNERTSDQGNGYKWGRDTDTSRWMEGGEGAGANKGGGVTAGAGVGATVGAGAELAAGTTMMKETRTSVNKG